MLNDSHGKRSCINNELDEAEDKTNWHIGTGVLHMTYRMYQSLGPGLSEEVDIICGVRHTLGFCRDQCPTFPYHYQLLFHVLYFYLPSSHFREEDLLKFVLGDFAIRIELSDLPRQVIQYCHFGFSVRKFHNGPSWRN